MWMEYLHYYKKNKIMKFNSITVDQPIVVLGHQKFTLFVIYEPHLCCLTSTIELKFKHFLQLNIFNNVTVDRV